VEVSCEVNHGIKVVFIVACSQPPSKQNRLDVHRIVQFSSSVAALHISWLFVVDTEGT